MEKEIKIRYAANEGYYNAIIWNISFMFALCIYFWLADKYVAALTFLFIFMLFSIITLHYKIKLENSEQESYLYSLGRPYSVIIADIVMKTLELGLFSIILDLSGKLSEKQGTLLEVLEFKHYMLIGIGVLSYIGSILLVYAPEAQAERNRDKA